MPVLAALAPFGEVLAGVLELALVRNACTSIYQYDVVAFGVQPLEVDVAVLALITEPGRSAAELVERRP